MASDERRRRATGEAGEVRERKETNDGQRGSVSGNRAFTGEISDGFNVGDAGIISDSSYVGNISLSLNTLAQCPPVTYAGNVPP
ncbi:hypothetical protein MA16_Dca022804 [Dendrobium catenatum]|uniref:Uncharacterized protein n=1 Tax=Dendrobium catenatum TaxID=906689 RepID=A0A2I0W7R6_9ASPA|nr:hypothetical protein MA16_Dca022804 [Dendrobium catenatum]